MKLFNCNYACKTSENFKVLYDQLDTNKVLPERIQDISNLASNENTGSEYEIDYDENLPEPAPLIQAQSQKPTIAPPHVCLDNSGPNKNLTNCIVQLDGKTLMLPEREGAKLNEEDLKAFGEGYCIHPLGEN